MANPTQQRTVADLEEAKDRVRSAQDIAMSDGDRRNYELYGIAATCIGIVEEMVKCVKPRRGECSTYRSSEVCDDTAFNLQDDTGWEVGLKFLDREDAEHLASLHNLWLRAVAAFGGEVR